MELETLVCRTSTNVEGFEYEILVYRRPDGFHLAKTYYSPNDVIINDGWVVEDVLERHRQLLPLAIVSRSLFMESRRLG